MEVTPLSHWSSFSIKQGLEKNPNEKVIIHLLFTDDSSLMVYQALIADLGCRIYHYTICNGVCRFKNHESEHKGKPYLYLYSLDNRNLA